MEELEAMDWYNQAYGPPCKDADLESCCSSTTVTKEKRTRSHDAGMDPSVVIRYSQGNLRELAL